MNYHNITTDDMRNGEGLRVVLWLAGCEHHCKNCQNPITWDPDGGVPFGVEAFNELIGYLKKDYISGITFSGGDPLHPNNRIMVLAMSRMIKTYLGKTVWLYTGYKWERVRYLRGIEYVDVIVDGPFVEELADVNYHWAGSTNQRVIDVRRSLVAGYVVYYEER